MNETLLVRAGWLVPAADAAVIEHGGALVRDGLVAETGAFA